MAAMRVRALETTRAGREPATNRNYRNPRILHGWVFPRAQHRGLSFFTSCEAPASCGRLWWVDDCHDTAAQYFPVPAGCEARLLF